jgi:hypothetical protein
LSSSSVAFVLWDGRFPQLRYLGSKYAPDVREQAFFLDGYRNDARVVPGVEAPHQD